MALSFLVGYIWVALCFIAGSVWSALSFVAGLVWAALPFFLVSGLVVYAGFLIWGEYLELLLTTLKTNPKGPLIRIDVSYGSACHELIVPAFSTFGDVKKSFAKRTGLEPGKQRLLFGGKEKKDEEHLHKAGVRDESKVIECPIELGTVVVARPGLGREERELGSNSLAMERRGEVMTASTRRGAAGGRGAAVREKWRRSGARKKRTWAGEVNGGCGQAAKGSDLGTPRGEARWGMGTGSGDGVDGAAGLEAKSWAEELDAPWIGEQRL
ncbi:hypothetical protein M0R45_004359 [Rubus argutus]|uniref:Ubiquitin-like domain-containing protein n=1 Tax=Rubus argutus TaxID=59490 RepID=A0AAW1YJL4_RUBAR